MSHITFNRPDGTEVPGYLFGEVTAGKPGVVMLQEWWGVDDQVKVHAQMVADKGYTVFIPDLYRGKLGIEREEAHHLMSNLDFKDAVKDIDAAAAYLKEKGSKVVFTIGFCMGGALALAANALSPAVDFTVGFYGIPNASLVTPDQIKKPAQVHTGANDRMQGFSSPESTNKWAEDVRAAGGDCESFVYPGVGHAFLNATETSIARKLQLGQGEHDQVQVDKAWNEVFAFFEKHSK